MSFDVFLERFDDGESVDIDPAAVQAVLEPLVRDRSPEHEYVRITTADGEADVYGYVTPMVGLLVNELEGEAVWDVLVDVARAAGLAISPEGGPTAVTDRSVVTHLPEELAGDVVLVSSGAELQAAVRGS